jgi:Tfp pilus assembly protein PilV
VSAEGFTFVEAIIALFILTLVSLTMAQMIGMGMLAEANSEGLTSVTTLAGNKIEELRNGGYSALSAGGDLDSNVSGYFETLDADGDGVDDFTRRWSIADQTGGKVLQVRVVSNLETIGEPREATMATVVAER